MQYKLPVVSLMLMLFPLCGFSADQTISCDQPEGTRVDYFAMNSINLENFKFIAGRDKVEGMQPRIVISNNGNDVSFIIGDAEQIKSQPKTGNMKVVVANEDQISFAGLVNGAPILATYYPKLSVLIYSQQSIWPGTDFQGARANIFYAKCRVQQPQEAPQPATPK